MEAYSIVGRTMDLYVELCTDLFAAIPEVAPEETKCMRGLGSCCLGVLLPFKVVAEGHTKIFGTVCDLKALTMVEIVDLSGVLLAYHDSQHPTLLWVVAHLPPEFQSSRAVRSCSLAESPSFLMCRYKSGSLANRLA